MSFTLGKRYLVILIIVYLLSTLFALKFPETMPENITAFYIYTVVFIIILLAVLCVFCIIFNKHKNAGNIGVFSFFLVVFFILGILRAFAFNNSIENRKALLTENATVCGVVKSSPSLSSTGKSYAINFDIYDVDGKATKDIPIKLYIPSESFIPKVGDIIKCKLSFNLINPPSFENGFSYQDYLLQNGIISAYYAQNPEFSGTKTLDFLTATGLKIRNIISDSVNIYTYDADNKELLKGILVGDVAGFSDELYNNYTDSGFIHIASVSGMHTSYILTIISFILVAVRFPKRFTSLIAIPVLIIFASVSLFTASVLRAVIMASILLLAGTLKRHNDSITALFISAFILVFYNPYTLTSTSFLLSYSATLGILVYFNLIKNRLRPLVFIKPPDFLRPATIWRIAGYSLNKYVVDSVSLSLSAGIGISYFSAKFFGKIQAGSIIGNIFIIFFVGVVFFLGYAACLLSFIWYDGACLISHIFINPFLRLINYIAKFFSKGIFHLNVPSPSASFFVVYLIICTAIYLLLTPTNCDDVF